MSVPEVGVLMVLAGEPASRLRRACRALAMQRRVRLRVVVAAPPADLERVRGAIEKGGAVASVDFVLNPGGGRSAGLNLALEASTTDIVCRVDARSLVPPDYVATCVRRLEADPEVAIVGGHQVPFAPGVCRWPRALARMLADPLATGGAPYRHRSASGPVDTVYLGAFRRTEVAGVGGWSEDLSANEDFDLSQRLRRAGRVVWLEEGLDVAYEARDRVGAVWQQYSAFGAAKVEYWRRSGTSPSLRQWLGLTAPPAALGAVGLTALRRPAHRTRALLAVAAGSALLEARRPAEGDPIVRAAAALLTPLPATAFSAGALRALTCGALAPWKDPQRG